MDSGEREGNYERHIKRQYQDGVMDALLLVLKKIEVLGATGSLTDLEEIVKSYYIKISGCRADELIRRLGGP